MAITLTYELGLFLTDLCEPTEDGGKPPPRWNMLAASPIGPIYGPRLKERYDVWRGLPKAATDGGAPFAFELKVADGGYDGFTLALKRIGEAVLAVPPELVSESAREAAQTVVTEIVPSLGVRQDSYVRTAARVGELRNQMAAHGAVLERLPVPGAVDGEVSNARVWGEARTRAAATMADLLSQRASVEETPLTEEQISLIFTFRSTTEGIVSRARAALADALANEPDRLRELDHGIFGLLDLAVARREAAAKGKKAAAAPSGDGEPSA